MYERAARGYARARAQPMLPLRVKVPGPPTGRRGDHLREGLTCVEAEGNEVQVGEEEGCKDPWTLGGRSLWSICDHGNSSPKKMNVFRIVCVTCDLQ